MRESNVSILSTPPPADDPALVKHGPRSWHAARPSALVALLDARPDLHRWEPSGRDVRRGELARFYHKDPAERERVPSSQLVVSRDGWCRVGGEQPERAACILDALAAPAEAPALPVEQLGLLDHLAGGAR